MHTALSLTDRFLASAGDDQGSIKSIFQSLCCHKLGNSSRSGSSPFSASLRVPSVLLNDLMAKHLYTSFLHVHLHPELTL
ncbi:hypothetical protein Moror_3270 [Moniliophthora roreri MCA 2997]|uniref:Uncharacterized protein n=1 Tax=Moniliophthora roreri (strain MCA 2997) TaxID=1381753 RepID=V2WNU3_MONRO|nr:hypothetical protein Moror_3270 [Moniliophthora roreri MCA 2997]